MTQTPALNVRDAMYERVKAMPFFYGFTFAKTKALRIQIENLPYCGVYLINELLLPDGDANTGMIRLRDSARVGFSVVVVDNQAEDGEATLDQAYAEISNGLFTDTTLTGFDRGLMQGLSRGERMHVFGSVALDNETPVLEMQFDLTVDLGISDYYPTITDDLERVHVTAHPMLHPDAPLIEMEWELETTPATLKGANDNGKNKSVSKSRKRAAASD